MMEHIVTIRPSPWGGYLVTASATLAEDGAAAAASSVRNARRAGRAIADRHGFSLTRWKNVDGKLIGYGRPVSP